MERLDRAEQMGLHVAALQDDLARLDETHRWTAAHTSRLTFPALSPSPGEVGAAPRDLRVRSQNGEDGILGSLLAAVGPTGFRAVEIGCGVIAESATAHLVVDRGWRGTFVDFDPAACASGRGWLSAQLGTEAGRAEVHEAKATIANVNDLLGQADDLDVLAIDVDGNDYWLWEASEATPPVVVIEYNASFGAELRASIPYDEAFQWRGRGQRQPSIDDCVYHGASLAALHFLGQSKGYSLAATDERGVNAFFVKTDRLGELQSLTPEQAWRPCAYRRALGTPAEQLAALRRQPIMLV